MRSTHFEEGDASDHGSRLKISKSPSQISQKLPKGSGKSSAKRATKA